MRFAAAVGGIVATALPDGQGTVPGAGRARRGQAVDESRWPISMLPTKRRAAEARPASRRSARPSGASQVEERNGARRLLITAGIEGANLSAVIPQIQSIVAATQLPPGYRLAIGGAYRQQQESFREFALVLGVALVLVFLVLLATFNSFRAPLVILATIPLSPIGVLLALWLTGTPINVASFMGLLLLVGIVVRNGILLIDAANRRRREGAGAGRRNARRRDGAAAADPDDDLRRDRRPAAAGARPRHRLGDAASRWRSPSSAGCRRRPPSRWCSSRCSMPRSRAASGRRARARAPDCSAAGALAGPTSSRG